MGNAIRFDIIEDKIIFIRNQHVIIDRDVALLYDVETKEINQAVKNNPDKFPEGYVIVLQKVEKTELVKNFDRFTRLKHSNRPPNAFTEKGLYMLATIIKGSAATKTTIAIVEAFAKIRLFARNLAELSENTEQKKQKSLIAKSGEIINDLFSFDKQNIDTETSIELNFAVLKFKHILKRKH